MRKVIVDIAKCVAVDVGSEESEVLLFERRMVI